MAQRGPLPPLRVTVPKLANSPSQRLSKYHIPVSPSPTPTATPSPVIHQRPHTARLWIPVLLQLSSLYAAHPWLTRSRDQSLIKFAFLAFSGSSIVLGFLQRPWKGRAISSCQWLLLLSSGGLLALSFLFRMRGLAEVGPLEAILAEYAGAVVGKVFIKAQKKVHGIGDAKVRGAVAFLAGLFLLSQGWTASSCSPLSSLLVPTTKTPKFSSARLTRSTRIGYTSESTGYIAGVRVRSQTEKDCDKYMYIGFPIVAGLLSSMQKLLPSKTSLTSIPKKRLVALTYLAAAAVLIPVAFFQLAFGEARNALDQTVLWPLMSVVVFGMVVAFYGEFFSEEKLLISSLSSYHFFVTVCSVCLLELTYGSNFSLLGFVVCCILLGIGVRAGAFISGGLDWDALSEKDYSGPSLLSMVKTPVYHIWTDVKTRKIAMFLLLNTSFMVVEFVYGFLSNSLGLISDACHMLFDCAALAIGLYASYISRLPPNSRFNFGYGRFEVLSGYANAVFLILVASLIVLESLERLLEPPEISTESLLFVSVGGLLVNVVGLIFFHEAHHHAHGSGPCTHVHTHHDKDVATVSSRHAKELGQMSFTHVHTLASVPAVSQSMGVTQFDGGDVESPILSLQRNSSLKHEQHDHSGDCSHGHNHHHADNPSPGPPSSQQSRLLPERQNSERCLHEHQQHGQYNPFVQQSPSHVKHQHSEGCAQGHCDHHGNSGSPHPSVVQHSHSHLDHKQVGVSSLNDHDHSHRKTWTHSSNYGVSNVPREHSHGHNSESHSHDEQEPADVSGLSQKVPGGGHSHEHGSPCSHHHEHHHEGHHHHEHGQSPTREGDHHHFDGASHGDHHHHHEGNHQHHHHQHEGDHHHHSHEGVHDEHHDHHHIDHNMEGIFLHILADTLGSVGVVISTILIKYKGWLFTDPACSIFISVLIISSVLPLVRNSAELLLQRVPRSAEKRIQKALRKIEEVEGVHDWHKLHVWSYTNTELVGTLRLHASIGSDKQLIHKKVSRILQDTGIVDLTLEIEDLEHAD